MENRLLYLFAVLLSLGILFPTLGQTTNDDQEYQKFRKMGEYNMSEGDYEKARRLLRVCLTLPKYEEDAYIKKLVEDCNAIVIAQQRYEKALQGNEEIAPVLEELLKLNILSPNDRFFKSRATQRIEQKADEYLKAGNVENATKLYELSYDLTPVVGVGFKLEQANNQYVIKHKKNSQSYLNYIRKKENKRPTVVSVNDADEYAQIIKAADEALRKGNYDLARRKYMAAMQVPNHENDQYAGEQITKATRLFRLGKQIEERQTQNDARGKLAYVRDALALSPNDATLRAQAAQAAVEVGDEMLAKELFADAKRFYQEAAKYGANGVAGKVTEAENKIKLKRQENAQKQAKQGETNQEKKKNQKTKKIELSKQIPASTTKKEQNVKPLKERKPRRETPVLVGGALTAGVSAAFPLLNNGGTNIKAPVSLQWHGGGQLIILPQSQLSPILGVNYVPIRFQTVNAAKTTSLENFAFNLLQIPVGLRYSYPLSNEDLRIQLVCGGTLNLPQKLNYTNYAMDINNTDINALNKKILGFYGGIGLSKNFNKRRSLSLMLNYQRTNNLLNPNFKDNATNRSRASLLWQGMGIELVFRVF